MAEGFSEHSGHQMTRFPFSSFPCGWFWVSSSDELPRGAVKPLHYFGTDLVLFRTMDGVPHVLDAHCPHLGAHLGYGGVVKDVAIECPFHGWKYDGGGKCIEVPYANKCPASARVFSWPVVEVNGTIMVYYHPSRWLPDWEFPEWPEYTSSAWTEFRKAHHWRIRSHVQELAENGLDSAHFAILHRQQTARMTTKSTETDGPTLIQRTFQYYNVFSLAKLFVTEVTGPLDLTLHGLGCGISRTCVNAKLRLDYAFAFYFTPVDEEVVEINSVLSMKKLPSRFLTHLLMRKAIKEGRYTIEQDIPIWENKCYREQPLLCDGDGPIMQYRRWASQFYNHDSQGTRPNCGAGVPPAKAAETAAPQQLSNRSSSDTHSGTDIRVLPRN